MGNHGTSGAAPKTGRQRQWLEALDPEAANLAAAIDHALRSNPPLTLRFCVALRGWWRARGRFAEAELAHSRSLDACGDGESALRARAFESRADIALWVGEFAAAEAYATEALALAEEVGDQRTAARARRDLGNAIAFTDPPAARAELARAADLARAAGDDRALVLAKQTTVLTHLYQGQHAHATRANEEVAALANGWATPSDRRRWAWSAVMAQFDGRFAEARDAIERLRAAVADTGEPVFEAFADAFEGLVDAWQGESDRPLRRLPARLERTLKLGAGNPVPYLLYRDRLCRACHRPGRAVRDRLAGLVALVEGRDAGMTTWAVSLLAEAQRLLAVEAAQEQRQNMAREVHVRGA